MPALNFSEKNDLNSSNDKFHFFLTLSLTLPVTPAYTVRIEEWLNIGMMGHKWWGTLDGSRTAV